MVGYLRILEKIKPRCWWRGSGESRICLSKKYCSCSSSSFTQLGEYTHTISRFIATHELLQAPGIEKKNVLKARVTKALTCTIAVSTQLSAISFFVFLTSRACFTAFSLTSFNWELLYPPRVKWYVLSGFWRSKVFQHFLYLLLNLRLRGSAELPKLLFSCFFGYSDKALN